MLCNPVLIVNDFSQTFYSYIGHWSLSKIEHIPWSKKLLNFLLRVRLIRSLAGIIKSLVSSEVDIWVSVAATPPPPSHTSERAARRISAQVYKLTKFGSKRANFGLVPSTQQPKRAEHTTQGGAELRHNLEKFLFPVFSVCKVDRKAPAFSCLWNKGRLCESWQSYGGSEKQTEIVTLSTAGQILQPIPCVGDKGGKSGDISRTLGTEKYAADGWVVELSPQEQYSWHCLLSIYSIAA